MRLTYTTTFLYIYSDLYLLFLYKPKGGSGKILDIIAAYESGLADAIKQESIRLGRVLTRHEVEELFRSFENMALWKPLIQRGRTKMASRDMALRDAFHYQLAEYIQPLDKDEYQKFLGAAGDELERLMAENQEVLKRLKERE